ncbi:MAG: cysteine synthase B [Lentisphaerae bacterium RIFOXYB12_FULL_65_16]|nr:MAG: cysteine synthase B [Lentisphaerae bacterium RIFOXYA12_64_32]OGV84414.1 MAG: cysteine synthase B [Lentisphaerae bacterium RIFOXYB12_FULL_65_16]
MEKTAPGARFPHLLDSIGNTPVVELARIGPPRGARILAKLEGTNPGGSVKDRPALWMIQRAEAEGRLTHGKVILEPTSGNTGIGIALVGACKGYRVKLVLPECVSMERRQTLLAYGAELVLTPAHERTDGAIRMAHHILSEEPDRYFMPNQFANPDNWRSHYETTGPEILTQTGGAVTAFVAGMGTTGTLMGVGRRLKEHNPRIQIVGVEPVEGHAIQGLKNMNEAIVPQIYEPARLDRKVTVEDRPAFSMTRRLALEEGLFVGMSSGAAVCGALEVAAELSPADIVVVLLPDRGDRYLSTSLFRSVCAECPP